MFSRRSGSSSLTATGCAAAQGQGAPDLKAAGLQVPPVLSQTVPTGLRERSLTPRARDERGGSGIPCGDGGRREYLDEGAAA